MKLTPYPAESERFRKVLKHVFNSKPERWWELLDGLPVWGADWNALRAASCLDADTGHLVASEKPVAAAVLTRNHEGWLLAAEEACDEALRAHRLYSGRDHRVEYVGDRGVLVVVARGDRLVTCYRPGTYRSGTSDAARTRRVNDRIAARAGVRRSQRHPSSGQADLRGRSEESAS